MKKTLLLFSSILTIGLSTMEAQYFTRFYNDGENPGRVNTDGEYPHPSTSNAPGWNVIWTGNETAATAYLSSQTIPFPFSFNGESVSRYFPSNFGTITFADNEPFIKPSRFNNDELPSVSIPDKSVCILGLAPRPNVTSGGTTFTSSIMTKTFGTAPNRQHWIWFNFFGEANIQSGWTYWGIVLEETTNDIYIVDMKTLCVNASSQLCNNNTRLSAGIQINTSTAISIAGSPNLGANQITQNIFTTEDNSYYRFSLSAPVNNSVRIREAVANPFNILTNGAVNIKAVIQNHGTENLRNLQASYRVNNGPWVESNVNISMLNSGGYQEITHPTPWMPTNTGSFNIDFRVKQPNGGNDPFDQDDEASITIQVVDTFVNRRSLFEVFSSSTCGPCRPGNVNLKSITDQMPSSNYAYIKYQFHFPGTGDPYTTLHGRQRGDFYNGITGVPTTLVDGVNRFNPNGATAPQITGYQAVPAFVDISASSFISWKDNINFSVDVKPYIDIPAGSRLHVALVEKVTRKNVKSNGETEFYNVLKQFAHGSAGKQMPALKKGETVKESGNLQINGNYRLPLDGQTSNLVNWASEHSIENFHNLALVIFIQNPLTKEIYQSQTVNVSMNTHVAQNDLEQLIQVYPNPANETLYIQNDIPEKTDVIIRNINGAVVYNTSMSPVQGSLLEVQTSSFTSGVYMVQFLSNGKSITKRVIITH
jgi:hypothetical protein